MRHQNRPASNILPTFLSFVVLASAQTALTPSSPLLKVGGYTGVFILFAVVCRRMIILLFHHVDTST
jgi:hypothetical protein